MKHSWLYLFLILLSCKTYSQINLVPNPSFEQYSTCPLNDGQIDYAIGWYNLGNSPDYFNSCSIDSNFSVPFNWGGYQVAASGNAYSAIGTYAPCCQDLREFIGAQLLNPLVVGEKYYISFKVNLSIADYIQSYMATNKTGVLFSMNSYTLSSPPSLNNFAHIYTNAIITDTLNWTIISGSFIADSAYQYLAIGNFFNDVNTDTISYRSDSAFRFAYYYIDDVCVSNDSLNCNHPVGIRGIMPPPLFNLFPNPVIDYFVINANVLMEPYDLTLTNAFGQKLLEEKNINLKSKTINVNSFNSGILLLNIKTCSQNFHYKLLKQ